MPRDMRIDFEDVDHSNVNIAVKLISAIAAKARRWTIDIAITKPPEPWDCVCSRVVCFAVQVWRACSASKSFAILTYNSPIIDGATPS